MWNSDVALEKRLINIGQAASFSGHSKEACYMSFLLSALRYSIQPETLLTSSFLLFLVISISIYHVTMFPFLSTVTHSYHCGRISYQFDGYVTYDAGTSVDRS